MRGAHKSAKKRVVTILLVFSALVVLLTIRIMWIQLANGKEYKKAQALEVFKSQIETPKRGMIYDRNGVVLAGNVPASTIVIDPSIIKKAKYDPQMIAEKLAGFLQLDKEEIKKKLGLSKSYALIQRKVDMDISDQIKKWMKAEKIRGIYIESDTKRYYPNNNLAAHVIGFTGVDNQGLNGVELQLEQYLKGVPGKKTTHKDVLGNNIPFGDEKVITAQDGYNVVLTIDQNIQFYTERALQKTIDQFKVLNGASAIVIDPRNGEVLALASKPDFNLNDPNKMPSGVTGLDSSIWVNLTESQKLEKLQATVWRNNAINITYEPGSTFKTFTAAAALDEGGITPESAVVDEPIKVSGWPIQCEHKPGHGRETFAESMYHSCNPVYVKLAHALGMEKFYKYLKAFGFYHETDIDLPGETNSIIQKKPSLIDMSVSSFGQSLQVTPIQLIMAYGSIANGGKLLKPQLVKELTDSQDKVVKKYSPELIRNVISKQTSNTLKELLRGVVLKGTGTNANIIGYDVAGKTGTSQTFMDGKRSEDRYIASFASFAPLENPVLCVLVVCDYPSTTSHFGGVVAAPVAREIIEESLGYLNYEKKLEEKDILQLSKEPEKPAENPYD